MAEAEAEERGMSPVVVNSGFEIELSHESFNMMTIIGDQRGGRRSEGFNFVEGGTPLSR